MAKSFEMRVRDTVGFGQFMNKALDQFESCGDVYLTCSDQKPDGVYSKKQRGSLHVWLQMFADLLNDSGYVYATRIKFNGDTIKLSWTMKNVKYDIYKPSLVALTGKRSTEDQSSIDPSVVAVELTRYFGEKHGIPLPDWPSNR